MSLKSLLDACYNIYREIWCGPPRIRGAMNQKSPKEIKRFASAVSKGHSLQRAMLDAGYAPSTARRGKAGLSKPMWEALARESNKLELLGRKISPERQENLVRGRLVLNTLRGRDNGSQSAKLLGADRRISMWQPESQVAWWSCRRHSSGRWIMRCPCCRRWRMKKTTPADPRLWSRRQAPRSSRQGRKLAPSS